MRRNYTYTCDAHREAYHPSCDPATKVKIVYYHGVPGSPRRTYVPGKGWARRPRRLMYDRPQKPQSREQWKSQRRCEFLRLQVRALQRQNATLRFNEPVYRDRGWCVWCGGTDYCHAMYCREVGVGL